MEDPDLEQLGINVVRGLAMDAPQRANSGHPGTAMALAMTRPLSVAAPDIAWVNCLNIYFHLRIAW